MSDNASAEQDESGLVGVQRCAAGPCALQRSFLTDAWDAISSAGPAVAEAARLAATVTTNPSALPMVMGAIAWERIPEQFKGPIIDDILRACLTMARGMSLAPIPGLPIATILQHVAIGALERALSYPTGMKVRVADRMARMVLNPTPAFSLGFLKGLLSGLWDGLTGPFVLLWDLAKISYEIQAAELRFLSGVAHADSRARMAADVQAALTVIEPRVAQAVAQLTAGKVNPSSILHLVDQLVTSALRGVESLGANLSDALLQFLNRPDDTLGEGVGYVAGTATFEVLLLVLTEGGYTALKEGVQGLRVVVRLAEAGANAWEALGPIRSALTAFKNFAGANRALAPLVEALEAAFGLLYKFLRASYGLAGAGAAERAGGRAAEAGERAASREIRVAETALGETHKITLLADGRLIRCSPRCLEIAESVIERAGTLLGEEGGPFITEAEKLAADARAVIADQALPAAERATKEADLLRRAEDLERRTAAAERAALDRAQGPASTSVENARKLIADNPGSGELEGLTGQLNQISESLERNRSLLHDPNPEMRELARGELAELEQQAADLERYARERAPKTAAPPGQVPADSMTHLQSNGRMIGQDGTRVTSVTVMDEGLGFRLDVENPNPGVRAGQLHLQSGDSKWLYNFNNNTWVPVPPAGTMPDRILRQVDTNPVVQRGMARARQYLGIP